MGRSGFYRGAIKCTRHFPLPSPFFLFFQLQTESPIASVCVGLCIETEKGFSSSASLSPSPAIGMFSILLPQSHHHTNIITIIVPINDHSPSFFSKHHHHHDDRDAKCMFLQTISRSLFPPPSFFQKEGKWDEASEGFHFLSLPSLSFSLLLV